ncbi:MAG: hypothetical protein KAJ75_09950 [Alphaproteobacteria bacterium]|nr:hypothetical protein [Alphaproteobacteria bacterium]
MPDKFSKDEIQIDVPMTIFLDLATMLDQRGLMITPVDATTKMLNAGIKAGAEDMQQAEAIYASMLLAGENEHKALKETLNKKR